MAEEKLKSEKALMLTQRHLNGDRKKNESPASVSMSNWIDIGTANL